MMVPSRSRKTAARCAHSRSASASAAATAGKLSSGSVRGSSSDPAPGDPRHDRGLAQRGDGAPVHRARARRRRAPPAWSEAPRPETSRRLPRTRPAPATGRASTGQSAASRPARRASSSGPTVSMRSTGIVAHGLRRVAVERQRGLEPRERHLVGPDRARDRVLAASRHRRLAAADNASRLRPAEQLVAAEQHEVGAGGQRVLHPGLAAQPPRLEDPRGVRFRRPPDTGARPRAPARRARPGRVSPRSRAARSWIDGR